MSFRRSVNSIKNFSIFIEKPRLFLLIRIALIFVSCTIAVFFYRLGSDRVDKGMTPGLRDLGTYLSAGKRLLNGDNPYVDPQVRTGSGILAILGVLNRFLEDNQLAWLVQIFVPVGIMVLAYSVLKFNISTSWPVLLCLPWLSSLRENLVNIQITGLLSFFVGTGILLLNSRSCFSQNVGTFLVAIGIEGKPHLLALFAVIFIYQKRGSGYVLRVIAGLIIIQLSMSLYVGENVTLSWVRTLLGLVEKKQQGNLGESIAIWPILERLGLSPRISTFLSILLLFLLMNWLLIAIYKGRVIREEFALLLPAFGIFFHYYDLAIVIALLTTRICLANLGVQILATLMIFTIPENFFNLTSFTLLIMVSALMLGVKSEAKLPQRIKTSFLSLSLWFAYANVVKYLSRIIDPHQIATSFAMLLVCSWIIHDARLQQRIGR